MIDQAIAKGVDDRPRSNLHRIRGLDVEPVTRPALRRYRLCLSEHGRHSPNPMPHTLLEALFPPNVGVRFVRILRSGDTAEAVIELLHEPDHAADLGERGRAHVMAHYTRDHFRARFPLALQYSARHWSLNPVR